MSIEFNNQITLESFKDNYWYKKELQEICQKFNLPSNGDKPTLQAKIEKLIINKFNLQKIDVQIKHVKANNIAPQVIPTNLNELMGSNFTCSELYRKFFKEKIGNHFHFTAHIIKYRREHSSLSFQRYIDEWEDEYRKRKDKSYKPAIMASTQYNQYIRDFFENNKNKSLKEAIKCWRYRKNLPGLKIYSKLDLLAL